jgi:hypothetical protein
MGLQSNCDIETTALDSRFSSPEVNIWLHMPYGQLAVPVNMTNVRFVLNGVGAIDKETKVVVHIFRYQLQFPLKRVSFIT